MTYKESSPEVRQFTLKALRTPGGHECDGEVCFETHTWKEVSALVGASESVLHRDWREMRGTLRNPASRRRASLLDILEDATCRTSPIPDGWYKREPLQGGKVALTPMADAIYQAWLTCTECPVVDACYEFVRPEEFFDGVCGKRVWSNGKDVTDRFLDLLAERDEKKKK